MALRVLDAGRWTPAETVELRHVPVLHPKLAMLEHEVLSLDLYDSDDDADIAEDGQLQPVVAAPGAGLMLQEVAVAVVPPSPHDE